MPKAKQQEDFSKNYASDLDFAQEIRNIYCPLLESLEADRATREEGWQQCYRAWSKDRTNDDASYDGISNIDLPQLRKECETMTRRIVKGMFPEDYIRAHTNILANEDLAQVNSEIVRHYLDNVMKFKSSATPWIKQGVILGTSPIRTFWRKDVNEQFIRKREMVLKNGVWTPTRTIKKEEITLYNAPVARAEDLFNVYVYPKNASSPDELQIIFYKGKVHRQFLEEKAKKGQVYGWEELKETGKETDQDFQESQERMSQFGESGTLTAPKGNELFDYLEIWMNLKLPGKDKPCPVVIEILNKEYVTRIQHNPYWHQQPPFDWFRYITGLPGEFYGRGLPEASLEVQQQLNDTIRQGVDSNTLSLNNITIVNPAFAPNADSFEIEPRAVWWADPAGVKQFQFPDLSDGAIKMGSFLRGIITEMSDNTPQLPDPLSGKARSTGQAQLALNEFQTDIIFFLQQMSDDSLKPFLKKVHSLLQQHVPDDDVIRISPKYSKSWINNVVDAGAIIGGFDFEWLTSIEMDGHTVKTNQLLNFMKIIIDMKRADPSMDIGVNLQNIFIKFLRDSMKIRDYHNIIESDRSDDSIDPGMESRLIEMGALISVNKNDDDDAHIIRHNADKARIKDPYKKSLMEQHIQEHMSKKEAKVREAVQMQAMIQQQQASGGQGNRTQIPQSDNEADMMRGMR